jgi:hypothetical protein
MKIDGIEISLIKHYEVGDVLDFQQEGKEHIKVLLVDRHANGMFVGFSVDCLSELKPMNEEDSNRGGYDASDLCKYLNSNEFMNILPDRLRDRVEAVRIPFVEEMFGSDDDYEDVNVTVKQLELMKARRNRIAFQGCDSNNWCWYWMMNRRKDSAANFANVNTNGNCNSNNASSSSGVRPVFLLNL